MRASGTGHLQTRAGTRVRGAGVQAVSPALRGRSGATRLDGGERTRDSQQNRGQTHGVSSALLVGFLNPNANRKPRASAPLETAPAGSGAVSDGPPRQRSIHVVKGPDRGKSSSAAGGESVIRAPAPTCTYDGRTSRPIPTSPPVSVRTDRGTTVPARDSDGRARRTRRPANPCTCRARSMTLILCGGLRKSGQSSTSRS